MADARPWVRAMRDKPAPFWALESLLREYPISSAEGLALMRLAEALLRVPDAETAVALTADQLGRADFEGEGHAGPHRMLASLSASAIALSKRFLPDAPGESGLFRRLGAQTVVAATVRAIQLLGRQFVLGRDIGEAMREAAQQRKAASALRFSYDMLGEGAGAPRPTPLTISPPTGTPSKPSPRRARVGTGPESADGISIKLSALFSRYEEAQRVRVLAVLVPHVGQLVELAAARRPRPHHRRRRERPARALARGVRAACADGGGIVARAGAASASRCRPTRRARSRSSTRWRASRARRRAALPWCGW